MERQPIANARIQALGWPFPCAEGNFDATTDKHHDAHHDAPAVEEVSVGDFLYQSMAL